MTDDPGERLTELVAEVASLKRELQHVNEQLRVEHAMMKDWKTRALAAEHVIEQSQKKADRTPQSNHRQSQREVDSTSPHGDLWHSGAIS
jgi:hypothetical protein